jgi:hypothetical protein
MAMDPVNPKALKDKFKDRQDKDIDNDGDVDSSDEYLHKRRSAVSKAISKVKEAVELDELSAVTLGKYSQKARTDALDHSGGPWGKKKDPARVAKRLSGDAMAVKKLDNIRSVINKK